MSTTPYRSSLRAGHDGFAWLLRAEWTKLRTMRGWIITIAIAALITVSLGLLGSAASHSSCSVMGEEVECPAVPVGPGGQAVDDKFYFVHQSLTGDGSITARLTDMTGVITYPPPDHDQIVEGMVPWAKTGVMIKNGTAQGSTYAAMMMTGSHGVRMQSDFTNDTAGTAGEVSESDPRWLRLARSGDTLTGYESADGRTWAKVDTVRLDGLGKTVQIGLFAASPGDLSVEPGVLGGINAQARLAIATGVFDQVDTTGETESDTWDGTDIGAELGLDGNTYHPGEMTESHGTFTVTGNGDIAPVAANTKGSPMEYTLSGAWVGLMVLIVVAVLYVTAEYRRGMIRTSLLVSPRRGRVLLAKAAVVGLVGFATGLVANGIAIIVGTHMLRANGNFVLPAPFATELRVIVGTAGMVALVAVFSLALGALLRRSVTAVTAAIAVIILPFILATTSVLPVSVAQWLLRVTPAAGFAIQQSIPEYPQVVEYYAPQTGYYPLSPWGGLAVLGGFTAAALIAAVLKLRRRDV